MATYILKTILKTKGRLIAQSIKKQMRYIKKRLVKGTTVQALRIGKENK